MTKRETERVSDERLNELAETYQANNSFNMKSADVASALRELQGRRRTPAGRDEIIEECAQQLERRSQMLLQRGDARGRSMADVVEEDIHAIRALKKDHP